MSSSLLGGTYLSDREFKEILKERSKPRARYNMSAGEAYSRFFEGLKQGKILGTYCESCGMVFIPPRIFCAYCFKPVNKWIEASDEGKVVSAVASYYSADMERLEKPEIIGIIKLDIPGMRFSSYRFPGILHRICGADLEDLVSQGIFDARVKARWKKEEERRGDINDIECFEVVRS
ncbi:MAG: Zn-ribbon domain-containing OB-fold protein [Sulfolobales archaeon]